MMTEPDVALTDYGLALESAVFAFLIYRRGIREWPLRTWFTAFFGSISLASFAGGTVHGFFNDEQTAGHAVLWSATLLAIGVTALAAWAIGADLLFSAKIARRVARAAAAELCVYGVIVLAFTREFWLAVAMYLPATLFLLVALVRRYRRAHDREIFIGIAGLALTFVGAALQQAEIPLHHAYFTHNALYHLIQGVALFMIFYAARFLTGTRTD
ncbi:MAG: DUF6962 family protein [Candidatus Binatia bacterium]